MLTERLISLSPKLLAQQISLRTNRRLLCRHLSITCQRHAKQKQDEGPIQFSTSKAASWSMTNSVVLPKRDIPWYQPFSISVSLAVFLVYFFWLREENDLDIELNRSLFERVPNLEENQVRVAIDYFRQQGKDTQELEQRLDEILRKKQIREEQGDSS